MPPITWNPTATYGSVSFVMPLMAVQFCDATYGLEPYGHIAALQFGDATQKHYIDTVLCLLCLFARLLCLEVLIAKNHCLGPRAGIIHTVYIYITLR